MTIVMQQQSRLQICDSVTQMLVEPFVLWSIGTAPYNPWSIIYAYTLQLQVSTLWKCAAHAEEGPAGPAPPERAAWNPLAAAWGYSLCFGAFQRWWEGWRRRKPAPDPVVEELRGIATRPEGAVPAEVTPSAQLRQWLQGVGGPEQR